MDKHIVLVGDADFTAQVLDVTEPVLVDFWANWCPPCRAMMPALESLAAQYRGQVRFVKVDVDEAMATSERFGIRAMPTLLMFRGGRVVGQLVGAAPRGKLQEWLCTTALVAEGSALTR